MPARHGAAGGQQVVQQHHALAGLHRIGLHLDPVGAVFQRVVQPDGRARQLARLAQHDEAEAEFQRQRRGDQEAAALDAGQHVGLVRADDVGQARHRRAPGRAVPQQGGDVVEQDARLREIRDAADMVAEVEVGVVRAIGVSVMAGPAGAFGHPDRPAARRAAPLKASAPAAATIRAAMVRRPAARPGARRPNRGAWRRGGAIRAGGLATRRGRCIWRACHASPSPSRSGLLGFLLYVGLVLRLADHVLQWHWLLQVPFFLVAGIAWAFPARWLMFWAAGQR